MTASTKHGFLATRAKITLRHSWPGVLQPDGELPRALPVLVAAGSKRLAVQNQVVVESGSFQLCRTSEAAEAGQIQIRNSTRPT